MFGKRNDGREAKNLSPVFRVIPCIMKERDDAQVFFNQDIVITAIEDYIAKKAEEGIKLSLMDIIFAAIVRIISERPQLNRFVMNGRIYDRNEITISLTIKKSLSDEAEETVIKVPFTGKENVFEVSKKLDEMERDKLISREERRTLEKKFATDGKTPEENLEDAKKIEQEKLKQEEKNKDEDELEGYDPRDPNYISEERLMRERGLNN